MAGRPRPGRGTLAVPPARLADLQAWNADNSCSPPFTAPIHGDLYAGYVIVDELGQVRGMIDWAEARVGAFDQTAVIGIS